MNLAHHVFRRPHSTVTIRVGWGQVWGSIPLVDGLMNHAILGARDEFDASRAGHDNANLPATDPALLNVCPRSSPSLGGAQRAKSRGP